MFRGATFENSRVEKDPVPTQISNVIVFGDSLSDIGKKVQTFGGKFAKKAGLMTVNPSGRFSDCRNWTDFMYEEATGKSLMTGDPTSSKTVSRLFQSFGQSSIVTIPNHNNKNFAYANYAEGGACGGIPAWSVSKPALGTFKDQVASYSQDYRNLNRPGITLFLVWFGANDLYTAGCKPSAMSGVAEKVANKRRHEISRLVGAVNAKFIFMNLARPEASVRYQEELRNRQGTKKDRFYKFMGGGVEKELNELRRGADLYNERLLHHAGQNGDVVVDIASVVNPEVVGAAIEELGLLEGAQPEGTSNTHVPSKVYSNPKLQKQYIGKTNLTTSDKAHPTDKVYELMWKQIKFTIQLKQYTFGNI
jgi:phospholipase/lecithinase/hemolysin